MTDAGHYDEQTIHLPVADFAMEIHGADGFGWYADKLDVALFNQEVRAYRKMEGIRNKEPERHGPVPFKTKSSGRGRANVFLLKADGSEMDLDWLLLNGALEPTPEPSM